MLVCEDRDSEHPLHHLARMRATTCNRSADKVARAHASVCCEIFLCAKNFLRTKRRMYDARIIADAESCATRTHVHNIIATCAQHLTHSRTTCAQHLRSMRYNFATSSHMCTQHRATCATSSQHARTCATCHQHVINMCADMSSDTLPTTPPTPPPLADRQPTLQPPIRPPHP